MSPYSRISYRRADGSRLLIKPFSIRFDLVGLELQLLQGSGFDELKVFRNLEMGFGLEQQPGATLRNWM